MSNFRYVLACCLILLLASMPGNVHAVSGGVTAPNILLILVDDVGYADIAAFFQPQCENRGFQSSFQSFTSCERVIKNETKRGN